MWQRGGLRPFTNGILATISRDMVFGGLYAVLKVIAVTEAHETCCISAHAPAPCFPLQLVFEHPMFGHDKVHNRFLGQVFAASMATIASSPWNYARNIKVQGCPRGRCAACWTLHCFDLLFLSVPTTVLLLAYFTDSIVP